jgi:hypothetical protein
MFPESGRIVAGTKFPKGERASKRRGLARGPTSTSVLAAFSGCVATSHRTTHSNETELRFRFGANTALQTAKIWRHPTRFERVTVAFGEQWPSYSSSRENILSANHNPEVTRSSQRDRLKVVCVIVGRKPDSASRARLSSSRKTGLLRWRCSRPPSLC